MLVSEAEGMLIATKCFCALLLVVFAVQVILNTEVDSCESPETRALLVMPGRQLGTDENES